MEEKRYAPGSRRGSVLAPVERWLLRQHPHASAASGRGFDMYESHFLLSHRPFTPAPNAEAYIPTGPLEEARKTLERCLERSEGPGLVIGPAGTGKSLLC